MSAIPEITEPMKAGWAMGWVAVAARKRLNRGLRQCEPKDPVDMHHVPPRAAVEEVRDAGRSIVAAAEEALALLDSEKSE